MGISDRIALIIKEKNISTRAFEQAIGCSNGVISRCINKGTDIQSLWLSKIIETYNDVNPGWLLTGLGDMFRTEPIKEPCPTPDNKHGRQPMTCNNQEILPATILDRLLNTISERETIIREQAEEIGRLREQIAQLKKGKGHSASDATTSEIANAG